MDLPLARRVHLLLTVVLVTWAALLGGGLGLLLAGRVMAVVVAGAAGLGAGAGAFIARRHVMAPFRAESRADSSDRAAVADRAEGYAVADGYAEGLAHAVLVGIATYQAAVFPVTPYGVTDEEREARRTVAYRVAAHDGLPHAIRATAAAALEAVDEGLDAEYARAALTALSAAVHAHRTTG
ncbi:hypothetical protein [Streptomyces bambusae]|uniref:Uncharacterized protein n=1 Tax=Streptomyces bambusae TaxID=1550616 RepID=A0ABS6YZV0_9ACTN|nr:hypothetical protein [Streptomyces bambusae]MBW5480992.1 hypothetical protein [Streptomyces bambusae]